MPANENTRLEALRRYGILDTPPEQGYDDLTRLATRLCEAPVSLISFIDSDRQWLKSQAGMELGEMSREQSLCAHTILGDEPLVSVTDLTADVRFADNPWVVSKPFFRSYAGAVLRTQDGHRLGTLSVLDVRARRRTADQKECLLALARQAVNQLEVRLLTETRARQVTLEETNRRLLALATTDGLTGLKNQRAFQEALREQFARSRRSALPFSLLMMDVDHFKQYNDTFGHPAGDEVLKQMALLLTRTVREGDIVARPGGEEFAVILPQTEARPALALAERLRRTIKTAPWPLRALTASFGISTYAPSMPGHDRMVAEADSAMYHSKENGRDRVSLFPAQPQLFRP